MKKIQLIINNLKNVLEKMGKTDGASMVAIDNNSLKILLDYIDDLQSKHGNN